MMDIVYGWLAIGLPLLLLGMYFLWRRYRTVMWMYVGALLVGLGYLTSTGAVSDVGSRVSALLGDGAKKTEPAATPKAPEKPATATKPAEATAPAAKQEPATPAEPTAPAPAGQPAEPAPNESAY